MTYYELAKGKIGKVLFLVAFFVLLMFSRNSMYTFAVVSFTVSQVILYGIIALLGISFLVIHRKRWKEIFTDPRMLDVLIVTVIFLVPILVKRDFQAMNFSILLCAYIAVFFSYFISCRELARYFVGVMAFLGLYSLVTCYVLAPMVNLGWFSVPELNYYTWRVFHNFVFAFPRIMDGYLRNFGMFREPGIYQFFLNLALFCNNFLLTWDKAWLKWSINVILALAAVSTFSTAGFVVVVLLMIAVFFQDKMYKDKRILILLAACAVIVIGVLIVSVVQQNILYNALYDMIEKLFVINASSAARYQAVFENLRVFFQNPLFGEKIAVALKVVENNTATTLLLYAAYGIVGGSLNVAGWLVLAWNKERSIWLNLFLFVTLLMSCNTQNFSADMFFWLFPMMALVEKGIPLLQSKLIKKKG